MDDAAFNTESVAADQLKAFIERIERLEEEKAGIAGDSKDYRAVLNYVLTLSRTEGLSRVQLVRHQAKSEDPKSPVSFTLSAAWNGARR